jgi:hypothetical protein
MVDEANTDDVEGDEGFGGDMKNDFADDIQQDKDDIQSDEIFNDAESADAGDVDLGDEGGEMDGIEGDDVMGDDEIAGDDSVEGKVDELSIKMDDILSKLDQFIGDEANEPEHADMDLSTEEPEASEDDVESDDSEQIEEATKFSNDVASTGQEKEGKLVGTGKGGQSVSVNKDSLKAPARKDYGGKAVTSKSGSGGKEADKSAGSNKDAPKNHNINPTQKKDVKADMSGEGKAVGTGKNSKVGSVNTSSVVPKRS